VNTQGGLWSKIDSTTLRIRPPLRRLPTLLLPRFLTGFRLGDLWRLLREHRYSVSPVFWPRAFLATLGAAATTSLARCEENVKTETLDPELLERPVFILGLPRSGTTHLFELLSQSPDLCFPTKFDAFNPHTFLLLRRMGIFALLSKLPKFTRLMDKVRVGWDSPEEDIVALFILSSRGERLPSVFPRTARAVSNLAADDSAKSKESLELIRALRSFTGKLVSLHGKQVLFKSPGHISRIEEILEVFPRARFVTIFRNPMHQAASLLNMRELGTDFYLALQWPPNVSYENIFGRQRSLLRHYFRSRDLIPAENLVEITFEELVKDRAGTVARICRMLSLKAPPGLNNFAAAARNARAPNPLPAPLVPLLQESYRALYNIGMYSGPGESNAVGLA